MVYIGLREYIESYKRRSRELNEVYENAVRKSYAEAGGKEWSKDKYETILLQYYEKYGEQVYSNNIMLKLEKETGLSKDFLKKDLKKLLS